MTEDDEEGDDIPIVGGFGDLPVFRCSVIPQRQRKKIAPPDE
jgi:hypothetical protein